MTTTLMGVETEYAVVGIGHGGRVLPVEETVARLMRTAMDTIPALNQRRSTLSSTFLQNGARFYVDAGMHPEMTTPECSNPTDCVRYINSGEEILTTLAQIVEEQFSDTKEVNVYRCNVDYASGGTTWGCHESYLYTTDLDELPPAMVPHFVSRLIFTGAGGFDSQHPGLQFALSPRSHHLSNEISRESQSARGIFHTKNEGLARSGLHRLHVICGESVSSHTSAWLKAATTALVLALADAGLHPGEALALQNPLKAMWAFSSDPACTRRVRLHDGRLITAIDIQRHYLDCVRAHLGESILPGWAEEACERWESTLDALAQNPLVLADTLDWPMKYVLFAETLSHHGLTWDKVRAWNRVVESVLGVSRRQREAWHSLEPDKLTPASTCALKEEAASLLRDRVIEWDEYPEYWNAIGLLKQADLRFGQLGPNGIFNRIDAQDGILKHRIVTRDAVTAGVTDPPAEGRANVRGRLIRQLAAEGSRFVCDWHGVWDLSNFRYVDLSDPFSPGADWEEVSTQLPENEFEFLAMVRARTLRRRDEARVQGPPIPSVLTHLQSALAPLTDRRDRRAAEIREIESGIRESGVLQEITARELNNIALEYRNDGLLDVAEALLRAALEVERYVYEPAHPKLPHRINNLSSVLLLKGDFEEVDRLTREAWTLKRNRHDMTSARILCLRIILAYSERSDADFFIGQCKSLLERRTPLRYDGDVAREWNFERPLETLRTRIAPDEWSLVNLIVSALNDRRRIAALNQHGRWNAAPAIPPATAWPTPVLRAEQSAGP